MHIEDAGVSETLPALQFLQADGAEPPTVNEYVPASQSVHTDAAFKLYMPPKQASQSSSIVSALANFPAGQFRQSTLSDNATPYCEGGQNLSATISEFISHNPRITTKFAELIGRNFMVQRISS